MRIGFIGTGTMGRPMVERLARAGFSVSAYDIEPSNLVGLEQIDVRVAESAIECSRGADCLILMVMNAADVNAALFSEKGAANSLKPEAVVVCMSTISPDELLELGRRLSELEVSLLDAPVSGGRAGAVDGSLSIMVGGNIRTLEEVTAVLEVFGSITHVGNLGSGQIAKAANQIIVSVSRAAIGEALRFAKQYGADLELLLKALQGGLADSPNLRSYGPRLLEMEDPVEFSSKVLKKDLDLICAAAEAQNLPLPFATLASASYRKYQD